MTESDHEIDVSLERRERDWTGPREWGNLVVAFAALALGVVSFWTTVQVSSLEDYLRSQIARDNGELNRLADRSAELEKNAARGVNRLQNLRETADDLLLSSLQSQQRLELANAELLNSQIELINSGSTLRDRELRLASLSKQVDEQSFKLEQIEMSQFFSTARYYRMFSASERDFDSSKGTTGREILEMLKNYGVGLDFGSDRVKILAVREKAPRICSFLEGYSPTFPTLVPIPDGPKPNGEPRTDATGKTEYYYTPSQLYDRNVALNEWTPRFTAAWDANTKRRELINKAQDYLRESASYCICRAIATERLKPESICPGQTDRPVRPDLTKPT